MSFRRKFQRARALDFKGWMCLAEAVWALLRARVVFARLPGGALIQRLSTEHAADVSQQANKDELLQISWAIGAAAGVLPWRTDCLIRCLAAERMLSRRAMSGQFHLGVAKEGENALSAHAWMTCEGVAIAGGDGFGFEPLLDSDSQMPVIRNTP